jgi:DNA polymerase V
MTQKNRTYIAIDLKSFYASVECVERGLDAMTTNLIVADKSRTDKTIVLAVSPSLKSFGVPGRPRLYEVVQIINTVNLKRKWYVPGGKLKGESYDYKELKKSPALAVSYIVAPPRMAHYLDCSTRIYGVYLKYIAPEDIHVYSIDEVFIDATMYLKMYGLSAHDLAMTMIRDVLKTTGITATVGIGTNMYLCKVAMDIVAKHMPADKDGVRIAELDEISYRKLLWQHQPLTDFWRIGNGYSRKLKKHGLNTMGDIARCSLGEVTEFYNENLLYKLFGINAELLIDHAWGREPCTIVDVKSYKPGSKSMGSGQVLHHAYTFEKARLIVQEMTDLLIIDLVDKNLLTNQMVIHIGYDRENLLNPKISKDYNGDIKTDHYGRKVPKHAHGTANLKRMTSSTRLITNAVLELYDRIVDKKLLIRRVNVTATNVVSESKVDKEPIQEQLDFFTDYKLMDQQKQEEDILIEKEKNIQKAVINMKKKYGKNAIIKGMNLEKGATAIERNQQIGGHKA